MRIQNNPRATQRESYWLTQGYWLIPSLGHFFVALATSWRRQVLLYVHSKCIGNCSMCIQSMAGAALFYHIGA
jgi:hypothetical protein